MEVDVREDETAIVGEIVDQAQLAGLLNRVSELGLPLVSVSQLPSAAARDA
jgi:hypothetical protein